MEGLCYDPFDWSVHDDPYPLYRRLRDEAPVSFNPEHGFFALARYGDLRHALADPDTYCSSRGITIEDLGDAMPPSMIVTDPPDHTRLRRMISASFTPRRVAELEAPVRALSRDLLAGSADSGRCDVITDLAAVLPITVICELLGVPAADQPAMRRWSVALIELAEGRASSPDAAMQAGFAIQMYFEGLLAERRTRLGDDLISDLMRVRDGADALTDVELLGFLWLLLVAGNDTSTRLLGNAVAALAEHPGERRKILDDPTLVPAAVEETLRYDGAAHMIVRTATRPVTVEGVEIPADAKVAMLLASGNRDERRWEDPDRFDVHRSAVGSLGFGHGPHHCLGAPLGRLETRVALEEVLAAFGEYEIDDAATTRAYSTSFRGYRTLVLESGR